MSSIDYKLINYGNLAEFHNQLLNDSSVSSLASWSSQKISKELEDKQGALTAGQNIAIDASGNISALGYIFNDVSGNFAEKFRQDAEDGGQLVANTTSGSYGAHAEGYATIASGIYGAHAEGQITTASGMSAHAEGLLSAASNGGSHAEGNQTIASAAASHAEGYGAQAIKTGEGQQQQSWGAHAEGWQTSAQADAAHAEGYKTLASGVGAHAEGGGINALSIKTTASGQYSHAEGYATQAQNPGEHAEGVGNISHTSGGQAIDSSSDTISAIGVASALSQSGLTRRNAREIMGNGDYYLLGVGNYDGVHIKGENGAPAGLKTLQEVINGKVDSADLSAYATIANVDASLALKQDALNASTGIVIDASNNIYVEVATTAEIDALFTPPAPAPTPLGTPPNDEIWYRTSDSQPITLKSSGDQYYPNEKFNVNVVSNTYANGKGIIKFDGNLTKIGGEMSDNNKLTEVSLPDSLLDVGYKYISASFNGDNNLRQVSVPGTLRSMGFKTFNGCYNATCEEDPECSWCGAICTVTDKLEEITFRGTQAQFEAALDGDISHDIPRGHKWNGDSEAYDWNSDFMTPTVVHCTDGDVDCEWSS